MVFAGCVLDQPTFTAWERHWAPPAQPFFVSDALAQRLPAWPRFTRREFGNSGVPLSLHDTFTTYRVAQTPPWVVWLDQDAFAGLRGPLKDELLGEQHAFGRTGVFSLGELDDLLTPSDLALLAARANDERFVWWPQLWHAVLPEARQGVLKAFVETDRLPCRHREVSPEHWRRISSLLPGARNLAGSFLSDSGGNCLATVMASFGASAVADRWVHPEPFERWLERFTLVHQDASAQLGDLSEPGTVLVWRAEGRVQHAAVSLGSDFVLHKEAQSWYAPRQVVALVDALERWQDDGRLSAYRMSKTAHQ